MSWRHLSLKDISKVIAGQSPKGMYYNSEGSGLPFYQGKKNFTQKFLGKPEKWTTKVTKEAFKGDILMSVRAPVGPVNIATEKVCIGRGLAAIRVNMDIDLDYVYNYLILNESKINGNEGAVFNSINKNQIESIPIPIPSLSEQKQIVETLDKAFEKIDKAIANAEQYLQNEKELFESYLQNVFENTGDDWEKKKLEKVCHRIFAGGDKPKEHFSNTKSNIYSIPVVSNGKKNNGISGYTNLPTVTQEAITVSARGTIGFTVHRKYPFVPIVRLIVLIPNQDHISCEYIYYYLQSIDLDRTGTSIPQLTVPMIKKYSILTPPLSEQKQIVNKFDKISAETKKLESIYSKRVADLKELKKSILEKAFKGELTSAA